VENSEFIQNGKFLTNLHKNKPNLLNITKAPIIHRKFYSWN